MAKHGVQRRFVEGIVDVLYQDLKPAGACFVALQCSLRAVADVVHKDAEEDVDSQLQTVWIAQDILAIVVVPDHRASVRQRDCVGGYHTVLADIPTSVSMLGMDARHAGSVARMIGFRWDFGHKVRLAPSDAEEGQ